MGRSHKKAKIEKFTYFRGKLAAKLMKFQIPEYLFEINPEQNVQKAINKLKMCMINPKKFSFGRKMYTRLVAELKEALEPKGWLLTAAVPAPSFRIEEGFEVRKISKV